MKTVTISTYSLRVKSRTGDFFDLRELPHRQTLLNLLDQYLNQLEHKVIRDEKTHVILVATKTIKKKHSISACIERGEYGISSKLLNVKSRIVTHRRSVNEAEMMPFYFLAAIPADSDMGVAAFQIESNAGIRAQFKEGFEDFLREKCGQVDLEIDKLVPKPLIEAYVQHQTVAKLRFVNIKVPRNISRALKGHNIGKDTTLELQVRVKQGRQLFLADRIVDVVNGKKSASRFVNIKGYEYESVKVEFDVGGKRRTIDFTNQDNFRADYDVTDKVKGPDGLPTFEGVDGAAREIVIDIMGSLGLETDGV